MKKIEKVFLLSFVFMSGSVLGQYSVGIGGGYGLPIFREVIGVSQFSGNGSSIAQNKPGEVKISFGEGSKLFVSFEYLLLKRFSIDFAIGYHSGQSYTVFTDNGNHNYGATIYEESRTNWSQISQIQSATTLKISTLRETKGYIKLGCLIGMLGKMKEVYLFSSDRQYDKYISPGVYERVIEHNTLDKTTRYTNGSSIGYILGFGMEDAINKEVSLFMEAALVGMSWSRAHLDVSELRNSVYSHSSSYEKFESKPYSSINLLVGLKWKFGKRDKSNITEEKK